MNNWYSKINIEDISLEQGDLIGDCPILIPPAEIDYEKGTEIQINYFDVIILTQSCDLENKKIEFVQVAPFKKFKEYIDQTYEQKPSEKNTKAIEAQFKALNQGNRHAYHILDKCIEYDDFIVVEFSSVFSIHIELLKKHILTQEKRVRLCSPYKEHLSQAFARYFIRVGLPSGISEFNAKEYL